MKFYCTNIPSLIFVVLWFLNFNNFNRYGEKCGKSSFKFCKNLWCFFVLTIFFSITLQNSSSEFFYDISWWYKEGHVELLPNWAFIFLSTWILQKNIIAFGYIDLIADIWGRHLSTKKTLKVFWVFSFISSKNVWKWSFSLPGSNPIASIIVI